MNEPLKITADATPDPALLRAAIEARLNGRPFPTPVEDAIAKQVHDAVEDRWR
jgi:hypothetical protein